MTGLAGARRSSAPQRVARPVKTFGGMPIPLREVAVPAISRTFFSMPERIQKPVEPGPWGPKQGDGGGPRSPDISRPDTKDLLKKMRKVDPNQSKRYRQRTGQ